MKEGNCVDGRRSTVYMYTHYASRDNGKTLFSMANERRGVFARTPLTHTTPIYVPIYCPVSLGVNGLFVSTRARACVCDPMCGGVVVGERSGGPSCRLMNRKRGRSAGGRTDERSCREIRLVTNDNFNIEFALNPLLPQRPPLSSRSSSRTSSVALAIYILLYILECVLYIIYKLNYIILGGGGALSLRYHTYILSTP